MLFTVGAHLESGSADTGSGWKEGWVATAMFWLQGCDLHASLLWLLDTTLVR